MRDFNVYAIDLRGHGASADGPSSSSSTAGGSDTEMGKEGAKGPPLDNEFECPLFVTDILDVLKQLSLKRPCVFGHSIGATLAIEAEGLQPGLWSRMFVFEPVINHKKKDVRDYLI
jgi:pimeloyl-ACP methyl ester carboxylesterase